MPTNINGSTGVSLVQDGTITSAKILDGSVAPVDLAQPLTLGTAQNTTSGTSIDFTGIPSWVKRITVMLSGVSTNGVSIPIIQIGNTTIVTTGYLGSSSTVTAGAASSIFTNGIGFRGDASAAVSSYGGVIALVLLDSLNNLWAASGVLSTSNTAGSYQIASTKLLTGTLDRIRLTTVNGTDVFDAGSVNILYEG
jgi:hypothetical protein